MYICILCVCPKLVPIFQLAELVVVLLLLFSMTWDKRDKRFSFLDNRGLLTFFLDKGGIAWTDITNGLMHISAVVGRKQHIKKKEKKKKSDK
jgi:hypothetical protein